MPRYLFVMSYSDPSRFDFVQRRLDGKNHVEVIFDRRFRERRRRDDPALTDRRQADRRRHDISGPLDNLGWALVSREHLPASTETSRKPVA